MLALLKDAPGAADPAGSVIAVLTLKGAALARLHRFDEAEQNIRRAEQLCTSSSELACAGVFRARGVLSLQQGQPNRARHFFEQTLDFARLHHDQFLEATALLNLGLGSLQQQHFDEAIDWTTAAYRIAAALDAGTIATKAEGNLGWAYYNLGDSEKSLDLSLDAEKRALQVGDVIDQLSWLTNAGYVYDQLRDFPRAKQSYLKALDLARKTEGREDVYNALRALALVSVQSGDLPQARTYSAEAIAIAQKDNHRLDELYPLLVQGMIAARAEDPAEAERIFRQVEGDPNVNASLRWRAQHELALLYDGQNHHDQADAEFRAALATFEAARSSLQRSESKLPFSTNAARIYDDYIHFLVARGKTEDALRWADYNRARTLQEGLGLLSHAASPSQLTGPADLQPREISRQRPEHAVFLLAGRKAVLPVGDHSDKKPVCSPCLPPRKSMRWYSVIASRSTVRKMFLLPAQTDARSTRRSSLRHNRCSRPIRDLSSCPTAA